ncbi:cullin protein 1 [Plasmopara halstedii]|uniref:Cullin protein 1 n=1 Tax=Plasmopara halstedii TaxID=4781 RepID=A0A0P1AT16_PLAHL|nr:cullin protein 1 [Plasmopara halstedii]CEG45293.1 cullin protein 1 [Plasmopara halstedii]|eukprot:XP_024581662.1 cullin protein 1 [Plasmopara halstedii]
MSGKSIISLEEGWDQEIKPKAIDVLLDILDKGFDQVKVSPFPPNAFMPIYTTCYNMCTQRSPFNFSEQLYDRHGQTFDTYLEHKVLPSLEQAHDEFFLQELVKRWTNHKLMMKWMSRFFMYLDRYYVKHHSLPTLDDAGLQSFDRVVFQKVKVRVKDAIIELIEKERNGEIIDTTLMKNCVEVFEVMGMKSLDVYQCCLEVDLVTSSAIYYERKSKGWLSEDSTPVYLLKVEEALQSERSRVHTYLHKSTEPKLVKKLECVLLEAAQKQLIDRENSGVIALLKNDKLEDLARMYRLFARLKNGLEPIADLVQQHITAVGNDIVAKRANAVASGNVRDPSSDPTFIKEILAIHDKFRSIVTDQFSGNSLFQKALKEAFVEFVNKDVGPDSSAKLMSTFCDRILKTGGEKLSDEQVEDYLEKVVFVFSYLTDKDLFAEIYRNQLAKRLLNQRSASADAEVLMIGKLKLRCGAQFTGKMEGMMNDLAIGSDHHQGFEGFLEKQRETESNEAALNIEFSVQVLTTGYWPSYRILEVTMPPLMVRCSATIRANFPKKKWYDLQVTTLQAVALLLFNDIDGALSFETIRESLNLSVDVVKRIMHSLSCGKYKLLNKTPAGKTISTTDEFAVNKAFASPMRKLRIPMASLEESHSQKNVEEDRSIAIEAAIVRIMKARKTLQHQQLISEVLSQLAFFKPNLKVIKRRIEALIDREYLERNPDQANTYRYLA